MGYYDGYSYETTVSGGDAVGITILLIYLIVLLVWGLVSLAGYILKGIGMYTIAKRRGMDYPWLACVPFARAYLQGELGGEIVLKDKKIQNPGIWFWRCRLSTEQFSLYFILFCGSRDRSFDLRNEQLQRTGSRICYRTACCGRFVYRSDGRIFRNL